MAVKLRKLQSQNETNCIAKSSRDDKLSERVKKTEKNGTQLGIKPRTI